MPICARAANTGTLSDSSHVHNTAGHRSDLQCSRSRSSSVRKKRRRISIHAAPARSAALQNPQILGPSDPIAVARLHAGRMRVCGCVGKRQGASPVSLIVRAFMCHMNNHIKILLFPMSHARRTHSLFIRSEKHVLPPLPCAIHTNTHTQMQSSPPNTWAYCMLSSFTLLRLREEARVPCACTVHYTECVHIFLCCPQHINIHIYRYAMRT